MDGNIRFLDAVHTVVHLLYCFYLIRNETVSYLFFFVFFYFHLFFVFVLFLLFVFVLLFYLIRNETVSYHFFFVFFHIHLLFVVVPTLLVVFVVLMFLEIVDPVLIIVLAFFLRLAYVEWQLVTQPILNPHNPFLKK